MTRLTTGWLAILRVALVGAVIAFLSACGQQTPEELMASAKQYLAKGNRDAAVIQLKNLLTQAPNNGEARLLLGQAMVEADDFVSAEKELARALELKQPHEQVLPLYVRSLFEQGKYEAVISSVEKYKLFNPAAVAATQTALAEAYLRLGNRSRAREGYEAALVAVPGYPRARLGEAKLAAAEGKLEEALKQTDEVVAADPKFAEALGFRADILLAKGEREGAKKALEQAVAVNGRFLPARLSLITLLSEDGDFEGAARLLESTRKVAPSDIRVNYLDASLAFRRGDRERARQQLQVVMKYLPNHVPSLVLLGAIDLQEKAWTAAEINLRTALARAPNHAGARLLLVQTYLRMGQPAKARDALRPLVEKGMPTNPQLLLLAGETYLANGDVKAASAYYQAASSAGQAQAVAAKTRLGQIALATGQSEEGFKELEAASELDAGQYQADLAIIAGHLRRDETDKALEAVKALEKKQPKNPLTFQMYGLVHLAKRDVPAARRNFEKALELQPNYLPAAYNLGMLDIAEKHPEDARKRYEAMIAKDDKNDQLYLALADLQQRTGAEPKAIGETLQRAVNANPQSVQARLALIEFHLRNKDTKAALTAAQNAMAAMPSEPRILEAAGVALEAAGETNQAIEAYNKLATLQPQAPQPLLRLAALHFRQNEPDKAIDSLRRAQALAPKDRTFVPQVVQILLASNRQEDAVKEARELQKRSPDSALGYALEGEIHVRQRKLPQAEAAFREALKREPNADLVAIRLYEVLLAIGKPAEADTFMKTWISKNPKNATVHTFLAERELAARNLQASAAQYRIVIEMEPNNASALNNLAWIGGELGDPKARSYAERAYKLAPRNPDVLDTYGMLLVKAGEAEKGLLLLEEARGLSPGNNERRLNYAKALAKAGRKDAARKELEALQGVKDDFAGKDEVAGLLKGL
jgi:putative PEP-CTERM system TPR-repeat lipoprotein